MYSNLDISEVYSRLKCHLQDFTYDKLTDDVKYLLDTLIDDTSLINEEFLYISKKMSKSLKRFWLEYEICKNPSLNAEELYLAAISNWAYATQEAKEISEGKKGILVGEFEYISGYNIAIYEIGIGKNLTFIIIPKSLHIISGYINLSLDNKLLIHRVRSDNKIYIKYFFEKWFLPKYGLNTSDLDLEKITEFYNE